VREGRTSPSARAVAFVRCLETGRLPDGRLFADPLAVHFLRFDERAQVALSRLPVLGSLYFGAVEALAPGLFGSTVGRTCFIDDALRAALAAGVEQVVILGAGYDCRAYRVAEIGRTPIVEVDHPRTQARKRAILARVQTATPPNLTWVAIDFERQRPADVMAAAGFQPGRRNFFIWEGVTQYLSRDAVDATLDYVATVSAADSRLVFTYEDVALIDGSLDFPGGRRLLLVNRLQGEPFRFGFDPPTLPSYLRARGLDLLEDVGGADYAKRYFAPLGRRLAATAYERTALVHVRGPAR
jgi:methyltransferase (TIGR00027 family)